MMAFEYLKLYLGLMFFLPCFKGQSQTAPINDAYETSQLMRRSDAGSGGSDDTKTWATYAGIDPMDVVSLHAKDSLMLSQKALSSRPGAKSSVQKQLGQEDALEKALSSRPGAKSSVQEQLGMKDVLEMQEKVHKLMEAEQLHADEPLALQPHEVKPMRSGSAAETKKQTTTTAAPGALTVDANATETTTAAPNETAANFTESSTAGPTSTTAAYKTIDQETYCLSTCHGCQYISNGEWECDSVAVMTSVTPEMCENKKNELAEGSIVLWCDPNLPTNPSLYHDPNEEEASTTLTHSTTEFGMLILSQSTTTTTTWWDAQRITVSNATDPMCDGEYVMHDVYNEAPRYLRTDGAMWIVLCGSSMEGPKCLGCEKHHGVLTYVISQYAIGTRDVNDFDEQCKIQSHCYAKSVAGLNHPEVFMMYEDLIEWYSMEPKQEAEDILSFDHLLLGHFLRETDQHGVHQVKDPHLQIAVDGNEYTLMGYKVFPFFRYKVGCDSEELYERQNDKMTCTPFSAAPFPVKTNFEADLEEYSVYEAAEKCEHYKDKCVGFDCMYAGPETKCRLHSCSKNNAPCYGCHEWEEQIMYNSQCVSANSSTTGIPENCAEDIQNCLKTLGCTMEVQTCKTDGMEVVGDWQHMAFYKLKHLCKEGSLCPYHDMIHAHSNHTWLEEPVHESVESNEENAEEEKKEERQRCLSKR
eukprot:gnl/MRDRNA2_/MRDRNA2_110727_c0_seq1.p1 gnl/MRDRNA2_/MRDRNA2_110727_c0~~gnl/MRDRNA2_/MRDRNA2_110727_c0_seq1.p1  ORF type:complete len:697 (+),score=103.57 gnl/MRDRNA2_/MRDRNA2_110727_c0_seq1:144-2234(+)